MKTCAILLALCLATAPISAIEMHRGNIITMTDADQAACDAGGGCVFVTREKLQEAVEEAVKRRAGNCMGSAAHRIGGE